MQELVRELVHGGAADAAADGRDDVGAVGAGRRVADGVPGDEAEADGALASEARHGAGLAGDPDVAAEHRIGEPFHDADAVGGVAPVGDPDGQAGEGVKHLGPRNRRNRLHFLCGDGPAYRRRAVAQRLEPEARLERAPGRLRVEPQHPAAPRAAGRRRSRAVASRA